MTFDFDELDDLMPADQPSIRSMSLDGFCQLGSKLRRAFGLRSQSMTESMDTLEPSASSTALATVSVENLVAEALWGDDAKSRLQRVTTELALLLADSGQSAKDIARALLGISLCPYPDLISSACDADNAPVVVIAGPPGCHADDLRSHADYYEARGFTTVTFVPCVYPPALREYQESLLTNALRSAGLAPTATSNPRLVVHMCGPVAAACLLPRWSRAVADKLSGPFRDLPALEDCIAALVWEAAPCCFGKAVVPRIASHSEEDKPAQVVRNDNCSPPPSLTLEEALAMQRKLYARFESDDFQDRLEDLERKCEKGSRQFIEERNGLFLQAQAPVLESFGFQPNQQGVLEMLRAGARWSKNEDFRRARDRLNELLGIASEGPRESERRLKVAQGEVTNEKGNRPVARTYNQPAPVADITDSAKENFRGDAALAQACIRDILQSFALEANFATPPRIHSEVLSELQKRVLLESQQTHDTDVLIALASTSLLRAGTKMLLLGVSCSAGSADTENVEVLAKWFGKYVVNGGDCKAFVSSRQVPREASAGIAMSPWYGDSDGCMQAVTRTLRQASLLAR